MKPLIITIDGPAGAGKSTVSRRLAEQLGYTYVDTGALYRAVALAAITKGCAPDDDRGLAEICTHLELRFENSTKGPRLYSNGDDITERIRTSEITTLASAVSARHVVREYLLEVQREMGIGGGAVFEGRDMGTVVFPDADVKFYLDANLDTRALRRFNELAAGESSIDLSKVREAMKKRDENDSSRALAPLKPAADAIRIDSEPLSVDEVVEVMLREIRASNN
ncbi:MAG: (d)CMP kinase [Deltaproteobacteria bacterium]|nr:(d)CMP kinase [Deltaproteobacteria bacterium]